MTDTVPLVGDDEMLVVIVDGKLVAFEKLPESNTSSLVERTLSWPTENEKVTPPPPQELISIMIKPRDNLFLYTYWVYILFLQKKTAD